MVGFLLSLEVFNKITSCDDKFNFSLIPVIELGGLEFSILVHLQLINPPHVTSLSCWRTVTHACSTGASVAEYLIFWLCMLDVVTVLILCCKWYCKYPSF